MKDFFRALVYNSFDKIKKGGSTMEHHTYMTVGTCSKQIDFDYEDGIIHNVVF